MEDLSFEEEYEIRAIQKNVRNVIIKVLYENYRAEDILQNEEQVQAIKDQVLSRINVEKYGIKKLLKNIPLLEELAKSNTVHVLNHIYKLTPVNDTKTKLENLNYNRFMRVVLKQIDKQKNQNPKGTK